MVKKETKKESKKWSRVITIKSNVLDLEPGVFTYTSPIKIANRLNFSRCKYEKKRNIFTISHEYA
jgi:hypothetical protein